MDRHSMKPFSLFVLLSVLVCQAIGLAEVVDIPDPNLREALEAALQINAGEDITKEALAGLEEVLDVRGRGIINLSGLEHCTSLTALYPGSNKVSDISSLANLTGLTHLLLYKNQLTDLSGLANSNLPNLTHLLLYENQLTDLSGLADANLLGLTYLNLNYNQLTDLNVLANANLPSLTWLELYGNQIRNITPLVENTGISGRINLKNNLLSSTALSTHIPALKARGITVEYDMPEGVVLFKDANLEKAIRDALGIPTELLKKEDLAGLKELT